MRLSAHALRRVGEILGEHGIESSFDAKEKCFRFTQPGDGCFYEFTLAPSATQLELVLAIVWDDHRLDHTMHGLVRKVARFRQPGFEHRPRYPRLPFSGEGQLRATVEFGLDLFDTIRATVESA